MRQTTLTFAKLRYSFRVLAAVAAVLGVLTSVATDEAGAQSALSRFLDGMEDLPLMPGLVQEPSSIVVFESPYGRIVETYASGVASADGVAAFYAVTLPQLGWTAGAGGTYRREGEILTLEIVEEAPAVTVRFIVSPPQL